jgi:hypothetical protein
MRFRTWIIILFSVALLTLVSFIWLFTQGKTDPMLGNVPYVFWVSFLVTCLIVALTFLGSKAFPYHESEGK